MLRIILHLLKIKDFEICPSCETLKQQLSIANEDRLRLTETLINIVKPKTYETPPIEINQIAQSSALFSRRRAALEEKDRLEAKILKEAKHIGVPDNLRKLEDELGITEEGA